MVRYAIWYHLYNLKNVTNTHGGALLLTSLLKLALQPATLLKVALLHGCFLGFLNCTNGTKLGNAPETRIIIFVVHQI